MPSIPIFDSGTRERNRKRLEALAMGGPMPNYGREGRDNIGYSGVLASPQVASPQASQNPPLSIPSPNIDTPGGYGQDLRNAGVSKAYSTKLALDKNRQIQGAKNNFSNFEANGRGADAAAILGSPVLDQQRQANAASIDRYKGLTPVVNRGAVLDNTAQDIANNYAPRFAESGLASQAAETGMTTAKTASEIGTETRAQGKYGVDMQQAGPRFQMEQDRSKAEVGRFGAETSKIGAETSAIDRDYKGQIGQLQTGYKQMQEQLRASQQMIDDLRAQLGQKNGTSGLDAEIGGQTQNELTPRANPPGPMAQMPQMQQANPQQMAQMPQLQQAQGQQPNAQRAVGETVTTAKGTFKWTGTGWVSAN